MRYRLLSVPLICLVFACAASSRSSAGQIVFLLVPGLTCSDISAGSMPAAARLFEHGAAGWIVCRSGASSADPVLPAQVASIDFGGRAPSPPAEKLNLPSTTSGKSVQVPGSAWSALLRRTAAARDGAAPGLLGELTHAAGLSTATIADAPETEQQNTALLAAADSVGRVDLAAGALKRVLPDALAPFGIRADIVLMGGLAAGLPPNAGLVTIVYLDLARAIRYAPACLPGVSARQRRQALLRLDRLLGDLWAQGAGNAPPTRIVLMGLPIRSDALDRLTPILLIGGGSGFLWSASTRQPGLVLNTDLAATVAAWLGVHAPDAAIGRPIRVRGAPLAAGEWQSGFRRIKLSSRLKEVFGGLPTLQLFLVVAGTAALLARRRTLAAPVASVAAALPLLLLLVPALKPSGVWVAGALLAAGAVLAAAAAWAIGRRIRGGGRWVVTAISAALVVGVAADLATGGAWIREAWMSFSVVEESRYYGIGNEYMGAAIGSALVVLSQAATIWPRAEWRAATAAGLGGLLTLLMAAPGLGAKVGAVPSAIVALGAAVVAWRAGCVRPIWLALLAGASALLLAAMAVVDARRSVAHQSHLARAIGGAGGSLLSIAERKLALEARLLISSPWSAVAGAAAAALILTRRRGPGPSAANSVIGAGLLWGSLVTLVTNDSGVTAVALMLLLGWAWTVSGEASAADPGAGAPANPARAQA